MKNGQALTPELEVERRRKISETMKRNPHGWAAPGYRPSEEKKANISAGLRRYWASAAGRARRKTSAAKAAVRRGRPDPEQGDGR